MRFTQGPITDGLRPWLSLWLTIHLFALVVCLAANRSTSELGRRLVRLLAPHSVVLHQDYGGVPLGLTYGDAVDSTHRLEIHYVPDNASATTDGVAEGAANSSSKLPSADSGWEAVGSMLALPIFDRRWKNFERMLAVAAAEKNEEVVQLCFDYAIQQQPSNRRALIDGIRFSRQPTLSFAMHQQIHRGELPETELDPLTLFECRVVRLGGDRIKLVPVLEKTRRAKSLEATRGVVDGQK